MKKPGKAFAFFTALLAVCLFWAAPQSSGEASAANTKSVTITKCAGTSRNLITVKAKVNNVATSTNGCYCLCALEPKTNHIYKVVGKIQSTKKRGQVLTYGLKTFDEVKNEPHREYALMKYCIAVKKKSGQYKRVSNTEYVVNPQDAADITATYFIPKTKKGLQTSDINQLITSKSSTAFNNLYVSSILENKSVKYRYNGKTYRFSDLTRYKDYVKAANRRNIQVTMQVMMDYNPNTKDLTYTGSSAGGPLHGFRIQKRASREKIEAMFCYLGDIFGQNDCFVSNWVLGNEIEMGRNTWYMGRSVSVNKMVDNYARTYRIFYNAVRCQRSSAKVFVCLGHLWNLSAGTGMYRGKDVLTVFAVKIKKLQSGVKWNLAFHPHPDLMYRPDFWNARAGYVKNSIYSPKITIKNLHVLTSYVRKKYGKGRRILVSEIGFHAGMGSKKQAAAVALAYYIAACDPQVDGFMLRAYYDDPNDYMDGIALKFGIKGRKAFKVFKYMDTTKWSKYSSSYLKSQVGSGWKKYVHYYKPKYFYKFRRNMALK